MRLSTAVFLSCLVTSTETVAIFCGEVICYLLLSGYEEAVPHTG